MSNRTSQKQITKNKTEAKISVCDIMKNNTSEVIKKWMSRNRTYKFSIINIGIPPEIDKFWNSFPKSFGCNLDNPLGVLFLLIVDKLVNTFKINGKFRHLLRLTK